jgi:hypothetical protein
LIDPAVIPAEATSGNGKRAGQKRMLSRLRGKFFVIWIPAFAGMTWFFAGGSNKQGAARMHATAICL